MIKFYINICEKWDENINLKEMEYKLAKLHHIITNCYFFLQLRSFKLINFKYLSYHLDPLSYLIVTFKPRITYFFKIWNSPKYYG